MICYSLSMPSRLCAFTGLVHTLFLQEALAGPYLLSWNLAPTDRLSSCPGFLKDLYTSSQGIFLSLWWQSEALMPCRFSWKCFLSPCAFGRSGLADCRGCWWQYFILQWCCFPCISAGRTEMQNSGSGQGSPCVRCFAARWGTSFVAGRVLSYCPNHNLGGCFVTKQGKDVGWMSLCSLTVLGGTLAATCYFGWVLFCNSNPGTELKALAWCKLACLPPPSAEWSNFNHFCLAFPRSIKSTSFSKLHVTAPLPSSGSWKA